MALGGELLRTTKQNDQNIVFKTYHSYIKYLQPYKCLHQIQKMYDDRIQKQIEKKINNHNRKQKRREEERLKKKQAKGKETEEHCGQDYEEGEAIPIKSKKAQLHKQKSLQFCEDHFAYDNTVVETDLGDFVNINYPKGCEDKQPEKALFGGEVVSDDLCDEDCLYETTTSTEKSGSKLPTSDVVQRIPLNESGETHSTDLRDLEEKTTKEETDRSVELFVPRNELSGSTESADANTSESCDIYETTIIVKAVECYNAKFEDAPELLENENETHNEANKNLILQSVSHACSVDKGDDSTNRKDQTVDAVDSGNALSHDLEEETNAAREPTVCSESSNAPVKCNSLYFPVTSEDLDNGQVDQSDVEAVKEEPGDEGISSYLSSSEIPRTTALNGEARNTQVY